MAKIHTDVALIYHAIQIMKQRMWDDAESEIITCTCMYIASMLETLFILYLYIYQIMDVRHL